MMRKIVFATNNRHKLDEIRKITEGKIEILSLTTSAAMTRLRNRQYIRRKCTHQSPIHKNKYGYDCFAEDTGLEVEALGNAPGVYSGSLCRQGLATRRQHQQTTR